MQTFEAVGPYDKFGGWKQRKAKDIETTIKF